MRLCLQTIHVYKDCVKVPPDNQPLTLSHWQLVDRRINPTEQAIPPTSWLRPVQDCRKTFVYLLPIFITDAVGGQIQH